MIYHNCNKFIYKFNYAKLLNFVGVWVNFAKRRNCKFIYNFNCADLLRFQGFALKFGRRPILSRFLELSHCLQWFVRSLQLCCGAAKVLIRIYKQVRRNLF
jgi:hypothetical protein